MTYEEWKNEQVIEARRKSVSELKLLVQYLLGDYTVKKPKKADIDNFLNKIKKNYKKMYGVTISCSEEEYMDEVLTGIKNGNSYLIERYYKDPIKQNFYEKKQIEYTKSHGIDIVKLPASGDSARYAIGNEICKGIDMKDKDRKNHKSIDYMVKHKGYTIYGPMKYTEENGGAQDNQFNDVQDELREVQYMTDENILFFAILDGDYYLSRYTKKGKNYQGTRLEYLNDEYGNMNRVAGNSDDFLRFLENL